MKHAAYMASPAWAKRKERYFRRHPRACWCCRTRARIHLHHLTYEHLGQEPDEDLMPLCGTCHELVHRYHQLRRDLELRDATMFAIAALRKPRCEPRRAPPPFVPANQRLSLKQRQKRIKGGRAGRLRDLPIRRVPAVAGNGRRRPPQDT